jgi:hypothetical protein
LAVSSPLSAHDALGDIERRERLLGVPQGREDRPGYLAPERMMRRRHRPGFDLLQLYRGIEDVDGGVDVVEVYDQLA